jgi:hypothetical protein
MNMHPIMQVNVAPFFSPEHSTDTLVDLINNVAQGGTIDIASPGYVHRRLTSGQIRVVITSWVAASH